MKRCIDSKILLGKILQRLEDKGYARVKGYNTFKFINHSITNVTLLRENGKEVRIPFNKMVTCIDYYKKNIHDYDSGPAQLRKVPITHITSPIFALLHLLPKSSYSFM